LSVGAFLGGIPAIIVALIFESPTIAVLTVVAYVLIQQLEGNFLTPRGSSPTEPRQGAA
jgi:predicted PurR-regulated permease PerM